MFYLFSQYFSIYQHKAPISKYYRLEIFEKRNNVSPGVSRILFNYSSNLGRYLQNSRAYKADLCIAAHGGYVHIRIII